MAAIDGGFIAELTYGTEVAWYRNVSAAGRCIVVVRGVEYPIDCIEPYPVTDGLRAFGFPQTMILRVLRRREFRSLRIARNHAQRSAPVVNP